MFLTPLKGAKQRLAAKKSGFQLLERVGIVRVEGNDSPGFSARLTKILAEKKLSLRGYSAARIGKRCVIYLAFDSQADAIQAVRTLKAKLKK